MLTHRSIRAHDDARRDTLRERKALTWERFAVVPGADQKGLA